MDYAKTAKAIADKVGGAKNIDSATHCMTRLRLTLKNENRADDSAVKAIPGVLQVVRQGGQYQIVIGSEVGEVYKEVAKLGKFAETSTKTGEDGEKKGIVNAFFGTLTAIFQPIIPALAGSGMIKALLALLVAFHLVESGSQTYQIFNAFGDALFYFIPFLLAFSSAKRFKCSPYIAAVLAGVLLHSSFVGLNTGEAVLLFGFIPVTMVSYGASIVPILLIVWVQSYVERFANKISPKPVKIFLAPMITIIVTGILGITIAGPLGNLVGQALSHVFSWLNDYAGWLIPMVMGAFCPFFVMTGMHYCFAPIQTMQYATLGYGTILGPGMLASNIAQGAASLVVGIRSKNKSLKQLAISAAPTALLGITEPALYGVTLKLRRPLYAVMIGGGAAGLYAGLTGIHTYSSTTAGLLALPVYIGGDSMMNVVNAAITIVISFVVTAAATFILGFKDPAMEAEAEGGAPGAAGEKAVAPLNDKSEIAVPVSGRAVDLAKVSDQTFASGVVGAGVAVIPGEGKLYAPADGTVSSLMETGHALSIRTAGGAELLLHVGVDTVKLRGKYFTPKVKQGDSVKRGDLLLEFDLDAIVKEGYDCTVMMTVANGDDFLDVVPVAEGDVAPGGRAITILR